MSERKEAWRLARVARPRHLLRTRFQTGLTSAREIILLPCTCLCNHSVGFPAGRITRCRQSSIGYQTFATPTAGQSFHFEVARRRGSDGSHRCTKRRASPRLHWFLNKRRQQLDQHITRSVKLGSVRSVPEYWRVAPFLPQTRSYLCYAPATPSHVQTQVMPTSTGRFRVMLVLPGK